MKHLYKYNLLQILRRWDDLFWALIFPIIMATLFYATFGSSTIDNMKAIPVACVHGENIAFETFLNEMDGEMLDAEWMEEEEAQKALETGKIDGIFFAKAEPSLTVSSAQMNESILGTLLQTYLQNQKLMGDIKDAHPLGLLGAIGSLTDYKELVEPVSTGGRTMDSSITYFFALIGMACLFGAFPGVTAAMQLRADQSALAARRSIVPLHRLHMVISEMLSVFAVQFVNICLLLLYMRFVLHISFGPKWPLLLPICIMGSMTGVAYGIFIGSLRMGEGAKTGLLVGSSLLMSFLAGMMMGNMKDIIEHVCPIVNRLNPAALISDAFYSISIYENPARYGRSLIILAVFTAVLVLASFGKLRRERYDSL